jgi:hypothetical protein
MKVQSIFFPLFFTSLILVACSASKELIEIKENNTSSEESDVSNSSSNTQHSSDEDKQEDSLFASMDRGYCYGKCPVYTIKIYKSGYAIYKGERFTDMIGVYSANISKKELDRLSRLAEEIDFASMENEYDSPVTDLPSTTTGIVIKGKLKTVRRRYNYPNSILQLEELFDEIIAGQSWIKIESNEDKK